MRPKSGSMRPTVQKLLSGKRAGTCRVESQLGGQVLDDLTGHALSRRRAFVESSLTEAVLLAVWFVGLLC